MVAAERVLFDRSTNEMRALTWTSIRFAPLPKSATPARIQSNALLYDFALDDNDMERLDALDKGKEGSISWNPVDWD